MKLLVVLVAGTLLAAGCGAELTPPEPTRPPSRIWGYLGVLGQAAENATARIWGIPLLQKLQSVAAELRAQARALGTAARAEAAEARERVAEYGAELRNVLEQGWGELRQRGGSYARKLRRRLNRDGDDLRRRWGGYGQSWGDGAAALRRLWGGGEVGGEEEGGVGGLGVPQVPPVLED